jgi:hypothetical protein
MEKQGRKSRSKSNPKTETDPPKTPIASSIPLLSAAPGFVSMCHRRERGPVELAVSGSQSAGWSGQDSGALASVRLRTQCGRMPSGSTQGSPAWQLQPTDERDLEYMPGLVGGDRNAEKTRLLPPNSAHPSLSYRLLFFARPPGCSPLLDFPPCFSIITAWQQHPVQP